MEVAIVIFFKVFRLNLSLKTLQIQLPQFFNYLVHVPRLFFHHFILSAHLQSPRHEFRDFNLLGKLLDGFDILVAWNPQDFGIQVGSAQEILDAERVLDIEMDGLRTPFGAGPEEVSIFVFVVFREVVEELVDVVAVLLLER